MRTSMTTFFGSYPTTRMRRNRRFDWSRRMIRENNLEPNDLILPLFIRDETHGSEFIDTMPGVKRYVIDDLSKVIDETKSLGIPAVALFPAIDPELKSPEAEEAWNPDNLLCRSIKRIKESHSDIGVICDVALDPFNSDGHDGLVQNGHVDNDSTIDALCRQALVQAQAGCDIIAPSDMMDGRIGKIREFLDKHDYQKVMIMCYAAKFSSSFYGPFRDAIDSSGFLAGETKDTYQIDPSNSNEAIREVALDINEGADMVMVKPGLPYLDIIWRVKEKFGLPTFAYNVSGEYSMIRFAAEAGALDLNNVMLETLISCKRAGCNGVVRDFVIEAARQLKS